MEDYRGYRVSSPFGNRVLNGEKEFHKGIDLVRAHKSAIGAFVGGKVLYAGLGKTGTGLGGYGNCVLLQVGNEAHLYAHLDSVTVKTGATVVAGQIIGYQGNTGKSKGSHLHFEVRKKASPSYGWVADSSGYLEPTGYLDALLAPKPAPQPATTLATKKLYLPKTSTSWRVYPTNKQPVKGNESGLLNPAKFGGLSYEILGNPQKDVYTIKTTNFGVVNIYAAPSTRAVIK
jgi:murein DD-endopeptidase MepM/ murein hydrolase activator NlpD